MGLPTEVLKAWEACDRTDTLFVLVCCVFCTSEFFLTLPWTDRHDALILCLLTSNQVGESYPL
jgi:quinol-cytochrome oxidoreductase complex cytochrome b subunit